MSQEEIELIDTSDMERVKLRVWWIPQVPMHPFRMPVSSIAEAARLTHALAMYDLFQYENQVKPDYSNAGGLEMYDSVEEDWVEWGDDDHEDIKEWMESNMEMWLTEEEMSDIVIEESCCGVCGEGDPNEPA